MRFWDYIVEQSVSVRAVPELILGEVGAAVNFFWQSFTLILLTSGLTMLKCVSDDNLVSKI